MLLLGFNVLAEQPCWTVAELRAPVGPVCVGQESQPCSVPTPECCGPGAGGWVPVPGVNQRGSGICHKVCGPIPLASTHVPVHRAHPVAVAHHVVDFP